MESKSIRTKSLEVQFDKDSKHGLTLTYDLEKNSVMVARFTKGQYTGRIRMQGYHGFLEWQDLTDEPLKEIDVQIYNKLRFVLE